MTDQMRRFVDSEHATSCMSLPYLRPPSRLRPCGYLCQRCLPLYSFNACRYLIEQSLLPISCAHWIFRGDRVRYLYGRKYWLLLSSLDFLLTCFCLVILILRTWALWGAKKRILLFLSVLFVVSQLTHIVITHT